MMKDFNNIFCFFYYAPVFGSLNVSSSLFAHHALSIPILPDLFTFNSTARLRRVFFPETKDPLLNISSTPVSSPTTRLKDAPRKSLAYRTHAVINPNITMTNLTEEQRLLDPTLTFNVRKISLPSHNNDFRDPFSTKGHSHPIA